MPTYEYVCPECRSKREIFYKTIMEAEWMENEEAPCCIECGAVLVRQMSVPAKPYVKW